MRNKLVFAGFLLMMPVLAFAQELGAIETLVGSIGNIVGLLIPVLMGLAMVVFFWGLVKFIISAGDEEGRSKGKQLMIWGIIALAVMVAVWGLVEVLLTMFGIDAGETFDAPPIPGGGSN